MLILPSPLTLHLIVLKVILRRRESFRLDSKGLTYAVPDEAREGRNTTLAFESAKALLNVSGSCSRCRALVA